jgi:hypothetical protein
MDYKTIELEHILLELKNKRTQHMRHFIDQYYCYEHNLITKSGKANWGKLFWMGYTSVKANALDKKNKSLVVKEHVIPLNIIVSFLSGIPTDELSIKKVKEILDSLLIYATITREEDAVMNKLGFRNKMPKIYTTVEDIKANAFERYKESKIELVFNKN